MGFHSEHLRNLELLAGRPARMIIIHYHLFKNGGTSVDEMLKANFGANWGEREFEYPESGESKFPYNANTLRDFILNNDHLSAISSHTALLPVPVFAGIEFFPILLIRHPLDRLRSAFLFERDQRADTAGARLARRSDFAGYLTGLMADPFDRAARNFQTYRLSFNEPAHVGSELDRALRVVQTFPFVGQVDKYDEAMARLGALLATRIEGFKTLVVRENVTQAPRPLPDRLARINQELGDALYEQVCAANADDLTLYEAVVQRGGN